MKEIEQAVGFRIERTAFEMMLKRDFQILPRTECPEDAGHLELDAHAASDPLE